MTAVYSIVYFGDDSLLEAGIEDAATYDVVLWCAPDITWVPEEGMRDGIDFRERAEAIISGSISRQLAVHRIAGPLDARLEAALRVCLPSG